MVSYEILALLFTVAFGVGVGVSAHGASNSEPVVKLLMSSMLIVGTAIIVIYAHEAPGNGQLFTVLLVTVLVGYVIVAALKRLGSKK